MAGFDEDMIRNGFGFRGQIHVLRPEPHDMDGFLLSLSSALDSFTAIVFTDKSTYHLPSAAEKIRAKRETRSFRSMWTWVRSMLGGR